MSETSNENNKNHKNGFGPVARDKYERILRNRITARINALQNKIGPHRNRALHAHLKEIGLDVKLSACRGYFAELSTSFGTETYVHPLWLKNDDPLLEVVTIGEGVEQILDHNAELKPLFDEIDRLREMESQVDEKVWLAGAPDEIVKLLYEVGDGTASGL